MTESVNTAPVSPASPHLTPAPRTRRVGTLTLGFALIIVGICLCVYLMWPSFDIFLVMKLVPLLLVVLGAELLWFTFRHRDERIRYDFLSTVMCALIFIGAFGCVTAAKYAEVATADNRSARLCDEWELAITQQLNGVEGVTSFSTYIDFDDWAMIESGVPSDLDEAARRGLIRHASVYVRLAGGYDSQEEFLKACEEVRDAVALCGVSHPDISFGTPDADASNPVAYSLDIGGAFDYSRPLEEICADRVETFTYEAPADGAQGAAELG